MGLTGVIVWAEIAPRAELDAARRLRPRARPRHGARAAQRSRRRAPGRMGGPPLWPGYPGCRHARAPRRLRRRKPGAGIGVRLCKADRATTLARVRSARWHRPRLQRAALPAHARAGARSAIRVRRPHVPARRTRRVAAAL